MSLSETRRVQHFHARYQIDKKTGCWVWLGCKADRNGYGCMVVKYKNVRAHRYSWAIHKGPIPRGLHVLHRCDNPPCVNPGHLFLGTDRDNTNDMLAKGRHKHGRLVGEQQPSAKLTWAIVERIRDEYRRGERGFGQNELAVKYGVTRNAIKRIVVGKGWVRP